MFREDIFSTDEKRGQKRTEPNDIGYSSWSFIWVGELDSSIRETSESVSEKKRSHSLDGQLKINKGLANHGETV